MIPNEYSFTRYLAAKKSVDDRALNAHVWHALADEVSALQHTCAPVPLCVLEVGAGIGTMIERLLERNLLARADYHAVDEQTENMKAASARLRAWTAARNFTLTEGPGDILQVTGPAGQPAISIMLETGDALELASRSESAARYDLLIAHAFLDLVHLPRALPRLLRTLRPGGLLYATINFDGVTAFEPAIDPPLDAVIERLYHQTMDGRLIRGQPSGDSHSGRHLLAQLAASGAEILAAGASDWVVHARRGRYPQDEAYFLHFITRTVAGALQDHPELDGPAFEAWIAARHAQIERGELIYIAHQLDVLARL